MTFEKEKKEEIDSAWSIADGFLSISATAYAGAIAWALAAVLGAAGILIHRVPLGSSGHCGIASVGWFFLGFGVYRLSLPFHRQNGEVFKSIFDLYRENVWQMTQLKTGELQAWERAWLYYQYKRLKCLTCGQANQRPGELCSKCGNPVLLFAELPLNTPPPKSVFQRATSGIRALVENLRGKEGSSHDTNRG